MLIKKSYEYCATSSLGLAICSLELRNFFSRIAIRSLDLHNPFSQIAIRSLDLHNPFSFPRFTLPVLSDCNSLPLIALCKSKGRIAIRDNESCKSRERIAQFIVTCTITIYFCFFFLKFLCAFRASVLNHIHSLNSICKKTETSKTVEPNQEKHLLF